MDNRSSTASDGGPGTATTPFRTIAAAVAKRAAPGNTIVVRPGVYPEQILVTASGVDGHPFTIAASAPGVIVDGADDFSAPSSWIQVSADVWLARDVRWSPIQVFADDARLAPAPADGQPAELPARTFRYVAGTGLYANAGGGNPASHGARVGRRAYGFLISGRSFVSIRGFTVTRTESRGLYLVDGSTDCEIAGNTATFSGTHGIHASGGARFIISDNVTSDHGNHGILLSGGVTASVVSGNESFRNVRVEERAANGIMVFGAPGNRIERNNLHDNQDSGLQINAGSHNTVCVRNLSWRNGDHGFDHLTSTGTVHLGEVAYGNAKDGFSIEGNSPGATLYNCIAVNNGDATGEYDLWVDANSAEGFVSDFNIIWNASGRAPVRIGPTVYTTLAAYGAATGRDARSVQADPRFVDPGTGDFRPLAGSPAIDAATTNPADWTVGDFDGNPPFDIEATGDIGVGPIGFADRGAFELVEAATGPSPTAELTVSPASGAHPLTVTADASASSDARAIVSYSFDFGDGAVTGPQRSPIVTHVYAAGRWMLRVTVRNAFGRESQAERVVSVSSGRSRAPILNVPATAIVSENTGITISVSAFDPDGPALASLSADFAGLPSGHRAKFTPGPENTTGTFSWTPSFAHSGAYTVTFRAANGEATTASTRISVLNVDRVPVVTAPRTLRGRLGREIVFDVTASDPDADPISSLVADLTQLPPGHTASFTPNAAKTAGTFRWIPLPGESGTYGVTFSASNALGVSTATSVEVRRTPESPSEPGGDSLSDPVPLVLDLSLGYPNPAAREITFALDLPRDCPVSWEVFDLLGRRVWRNQRDLVAGRYVLSWDGTNESGERMGAGVYMARVRVESTTWNRRFVKL